MDNSVKLDKLAFWLDKTYCVRIMPSHSQNVKKINKFIFPQLLWEMRKNNPISTRFQMLKNASLQACMLCIYP